MLLHEVLHVAGKQSFPYRLVGGALHVGGHLCERGRLFQEVAVYDPRGPAHEPLEPVVAVYVRGSQPRNLLGVVLLVVPAEHVVAARERLEAVRVHRMDVETVLPELQVVYHLALQHVADVGARGHPEVREQLLGDARAANKVAPFEHENLSPLAGQVVGSHKPIVSGADDNGGVGQCEAPSEVGNGTQCILFKGERRVRCGGEGWTSR